MSSSRSMLELVGLLLHWLASLLNSRRRLQAENLLLRHQLNILRRRAPRSLWLRTVDRLAFVSLYRLCPAVVDAVAIVRPETVIRWHRRGFKAFWRWKSRSRGGRPAIPREVRDLIREMSRANCSWGAPRIHGELLKLGIEVAQSTIAKYMVRHPGRPGQSWATFLRNHADGMAAADLFVVPTVGFKLLYGLVILSHGRRRLLHQAATDHPTAEWVARQIVEAFPWDEAPQYLVRDRDAVYGEVVKRRLRGLGIRDRPVAPRSPWQNAFVERLIGSYDVSVLTTWSCLARHTFTGSCPRTPAITTRPVRTLLSGRMHRSAGPSTGLAGSLPSPWSAACTTDTLESNFR
jgi:hypothetical protein